ncbi:MAG: hypothetical protein A2268_08110 [Candidatus Raymondbacteria bacterium RifOxyA12_full_50_37]|uniref:Secretion system C-terminal sorting domain-containing protein n=1 Tax=Candidatus Raymondbacteria bacterium RIFOXYD12_FULL_49_13 TaxID=1817890 RepID=A0A1F7F1G3_UNCRA|nr:MAG: hypothetical protein A2268_08110 [Candidatus Raymondbacteria bacterium RifOxyA12_full_50_37]OGJ93315.1 MAG: hypothetical protein A2487_06825 [Candidatus Raymondbacteria bacterium RifOxyC12_full_50_8]OGJ93531.1 MAG: hypothetical protein A2248_09155 [Candidatus Raymondbacteria bacterium RIFOXYA2_FULL_49_16]OGJ98801.1 MAG: hypothetical protein A2453_09965 [Candidatus Raymondbacteria bacterium RIFOXYC2_FULL_50_21]OGK00336.1 MAG: hypothetical protein A2519_01075 [Candidatus Raymondbacteria b
MTLKTIAAAAVYAALFSFPAMAAPAVDSSGAFTGTVYDSAAQIPLEGALVVLSQYTINPLEIDTFLTGADGKFSFTNLLTGSRNKYTISVSADSFRSTFKSDLVLAKDQTDTINFFLIETDSVIIPPVDSGIIVGTVYDTVTNDPIAGALVILNQGTGRVTVFVDSIRTDASGSYSFENLSFAIRFMVSVSKQGYLPGVSGGTYLYSSTPIDTIDFHLIPMDTSNSWIISGKITADSSTGETLENVSVVFTQRYGTENKYTGTTDAAGVYTIMLPAQELGYTVTASLDGYIPFEQNHSVSADSSELDIVLVWDGNTSMEVAAVNTGNTTLQTFPNPCKDVSTISLHMAKAGQVNVAVYAIDGTLISTLAHGAMNPGAYSLPLQTNRLAAGVYVVRVKTGDIHLSQKLLLTK